MAFQVFTERRPTSTELDGSVHVLTGGGGRAEVWPALGFNCYRWQRSVAGAPLDLLYADPRLFDGASPTRSGVPILFPFPNRIREGRFVWAGREYQLPCNDSTKKNAIHGFPCRKPWRVIGQGADAGSAWVTGEFHGATDAPEARAFWPADYLLRVTYRLTELGLRVEAEVTNPDRLALPFGLGYHPYVRVPLLPAGGEADCWVESAAREIWELKDSLPTGERRPVDAARNLTTGRRLSELTLDDLFSDLESPPPPAGALYWRGAVRQGTAEVRLLTDAAFGELVLFTPPHRQAVCLEPYTCATDAINLQQRGIAAGLRVLQPGERWMGVVEFAGP